MKYFLYRPAGHRPQVWQITDSRALRYGLSNAANSPGGFFDAAPGETIWTALERQTGWFGPNGENPFIELDLSPGEFYPRIIRPIDQHPDDGLGYNRNGLDYPNELAVEQSQLAVLFRQLDRICQTVHPRDANMAAFGHDIRNLLILACTEVEAQWQAVFAANGKTGQHSTADYVGLNAAMGLSAFSVRFPAYPWLDRFAPFRFWDRSAPSKTLPWYDAYNDTKHNREFRFASATLKHVFDAIAANVIMLVAQFGIVLGVPSHSDFAGKFELAEVPDWPLGSIYTLPYEVPDGQWTPKNYDFSMERPAPMSKPYHPPPKGLMRH
jgi:hypothetical protein